MDPTQCYREMFDAVQDGDLATARQRALDLRHWLERGGFNPQGFSKAEVQSYLENVLLRTSAMAHKVEDSG